jgi:predicted O-linked N-acetylglucosamine transferase (SPINDLY family)
MARPLQIPHRLPKSKKQAQQPNTEITRLYQQGLGLHKQGQLTQAKSLYEQVLIMQPQHFDALHLLGVIAVKDGNPELAEELIGKAIEINPNFATAHFNRGAALKRLNRLNEAIASYDKAIAIKPDYVQAFQSRGDVQLDLHQYDEALASYDKAISLKSDIPAAFVNRGLTLHRLKRLDEALANCEKAIALKPDFAEAFHLRGTVLKDLQRLEEALSSYDKAIFFKPDFAIAFNNRGITLQALKRLGEALESYDMAIALKPDYPEVLNNQGNTLHELKRLGEALKCYDKAIALKPDFAEVFENRGNSLKLGKQIDGALASYVKAITLKPDLPFLLGTKLHTQLHLCDWRDLTVQINKLETAIDQELKVTRPWALLGLTDKPELQLKASKLNAKSKFKALEFLGDFKRRDSSERIRIGYYSADFHNHATAYLMAELFEAHDAQRFELFGFSFGPDVQDEMRQRVTAGFDHFFDVTQKSDPEVALMSRALGIDIAVDLKGYTQDARTGIFAQRCAPVQVNYLGYPGTMGAPFFDYIVADKVLIPPESQQHYSEKVVYLPHSYQVNDAKRKISDTLFTRQALGLPESGFVFCCFNNNYKILPTTFDAWMRLLKAVDGSVLWLFENNATAAHNLRQEAQARGVEPSRLVFAKHVQLEDHLARHRAADLFLDTLPCNAHTTTSDALWAGLPVLTLMGQTFAARVAASLLTAMDLPELITHTQEDYEARALELAQNPLQLARLKDKLERNRATSTLFNGQLFARHLEAAYVQMHKRHLSGERPELIEVQALVV